MDILKYVLAQATGWCAGFLMRVWMRYFADTVKWGKVLNRTKRREGHSITFCTHFYLASPCRSLLPYNWLECPAFIDLPQQAFSVTCIDDLWERNICHLQHADVSIVVVIVLVMIVIVIIIRIIVTIMIRDCAFSSVTWHIPIPIFLWLSPSHFCCTHFAIYQIDRTAPALSCMSQ
jgi:hypothetical protein